jgi:hypothetical protein
MTCNSSISAVCVIKTIPNKSPGVEANWATTPTPGLRKDPRRLIEPRCAPRENYHPQDPNNQKFYTKSTFKRKLPVPPGIAMSDLSNGTKKHTLKYREAIPLTSNKLMNTGIQYSINMIVKHWMVCEIVFSYVILKSAYYVHDLKAKIMSVTQALLAHLHKWWIQLFCVIIFSLVLMPLLILITQIISRIQFIFCLMFQISGLRPNHYA